MGPNPFSAILLPFLSFFTILYLLYSLNLFLFPFTSLFFHRKLHIQPMTRRRRRRNSRHLIARLALRLSAPVRTAVSFIVVAGLLWGLWAFFLSPLTRIWQGVFGTVDYPVEFPVRGIDVSHHQGPIDWEKVSSAEVGGSPLTFAFIKATEGTSLTDERFAENMDGARRAGLMCGAYHYYSPGSSARRQADFFVRHVHLQPGDLPPVLDIEQTGDLSSRALRDSALVWLRLVERHYGVRPILYTYHNFRSRHLSTPVFDDYPYWIAHYYVDTLHYEGRWHFWQHTDRGRVAGIKGNVDINCFNGSVYALRQLTLGEE